MEEGRGGASCDIVAGEVHDVEKDRQAKDDTGCTETKKGDGLEMEAIDGMCTRGRDTYGPPNS